eukprot:GHVQ01031785.1.p1 GENE.GHVQ01031785.1~~GHVQ01031785.1.p1  ORF type:complete len:368 (-),score=24.62 GHVQ01031785.1:280-1221(-)
MICYQRQRGWGCVSLVLCSVMAMLRGHVQQQDAPTLVLAVAQPVQQHCERIVTNLESLDNNSHKDDNAQMATPVAEPKILSAQEALIDGVLELGKYSRSGASNMPYHAFKRVIKTLNVSESHQLALHYTFLCKMDLPPREFVRRLTTYRRMLKCVQILDRAFENESVDANQLIEDFKSTDLIFRSLVDQYSAENEGYDVAKFLDSNPPESFLLKLAVPNADVISDCLVRVLVGGPKPVFALPRDEDLAVVAFAEEDSIVKRIQTTYQLLFKITAGACPDPECDGVKKHCYRMPYPNLWHFVLVKLLLAFGGKE